MSNELYTYILIGVFLGSILDLFNNLSSLLFDFINNKRLIIYKITIGYSENDTMFDEYYYYHKKNVNKLFNDMVKNYEVNYFCIEIIDTYNSKRIKFYNLDDYNIGKFQKEESTLYLLKKELKKWFFGSDKND